MIVRQMVNDEKNSSGPQTDKLPPCCPNLPVCPNDFSLVLSGNSRLLYFLELHLLLETTPVFVKAKKAKKYQQVGWAVPMLLF